MRLTIADREAFVRAAMDDVPKVDYSKLAKEVVIKFLKETVPVDIQNMIVKYPEWFQAYTVCMPHNIDHFSTPLAHRYREWQAVITDETLRSRIRELSAAATKQSDERLAIHQKLHSAIGSCTTLKQATELLPEFVKYLPQERNGTVVRSMPVVANLVTDMMNMGWPKGKDDGKAAQKHSTN
jgi:hypothetical protein